MWMWQQELGGEGRAWGRGGGSVISVSICGERWHTARCEAHLSLTFTFLLLFSHTDVGLRASVHAVRRGRGGNLNQKCVEKSAREVGVNQLPGQRRPRSSGCSVRHIFGSDSRVKTLLMRLWEIRCHRFKSLKKKKVAI